MDSQGNPLKLYNYYRVEPQGSKAQFVGMDSNLYLFEWINSLNKRKMIRKNEQQLIDSPPVLIDDDLTDEEFLENPFTNDTQPGTGGRKNKTKRVKSGKRLKRAKSVKRVKSGKRVKSVKSVKSGKRTKK